MPWHSQIYSYFIFQLVTLIGLWVIPLYFNIKLMWYRMLTVWTIFSVITLFIIHKAAKAPLQPTTPRYGMENIILIKQFNHIPSLHYLRVSRIFSTSLPERGKEDSFRFRVAVMKIFISSLQTIYALTSVTLKVLFFFQIKTAVKAILSHLSPLSSDCSLLYSCLITISLQIGVQMVLQCSSGYIWTGCCRILHHYVYIPWLEPSALCFS